MLLRSILQQLGDNAKDILHETAALVSGESETERRCREHEAMIRAKKTMTTYLDQKRVLIVLDDVGEKKDMDWFDFRSEGTDGPVVLFTTRSPASWKDSAGTVDVGASMDEHAAIQLLHQECARTTRLLNGKALELRAKDFSDSVEVKSFVQKCGFHPSVVSLFGRFLSLHSVQSDSDVSSSLKTIDRLLTDAPFNVDDNTLSSRLELCLSSNSSDIPTMILNVCVVAYVEVFFSRRQLLHVGADSISPTVPIEIVELLFESLLAFDEATFKDEAEVLYGDRKNAATLIRTILGALGILSDPSNLESTGLPPRFVREFASSLIDNNASIAQLVSRGAWHRALVTNVMDSEKDRTASVEDGRARYLASRMPLHLIMGEMFIEAGDMLSNRGFVKRRIRCLGLTAAVQVHIQDVEFLLERLVPGPIESRTSSMQYYLQVIQQAYQAMVDAIGKIETGGGVEDQDVSRALVDIGMSFSKWGCHDDSIACWNSSMLASPMTLADRSTVFFNIGTAHASLGEFDEAVASLKECLKLQKLHYGDNDMTCAATAKKIGDTLFASTRFAEALDEYTVALDILVCHGKEKSAHLLVADIEETMGTIYFKRQEYAKALDHYMDALRSLKLCYGKSDPQLSSIYLRLGMCMFDKGAMAEAVDASERSLAFREANSDAENPDILVTKGLLARAKGDKKESIDLLRRSVEALKDDSVERSSNQDEAFILHVLGQLYSEEGKEKKAMKAFEASKSEACRIHGESHVDVAASLCAIAKLHEKQGRFTEATKCLEEARRIQARCLPDSEALEATTRQLAFILQGKEGEI
eukprot:Sro155_g070470.1 Kinesin light chain (813) ;mRNA; r:73450-75888